MENIEKKENKNLNKDISKRKMVQGKHTGKNLEENDNKNEDFYKLDENDVKIDELLKEMKLEDDIKVQNENSNFVDEFINKLDKIKIEK